LGRGLASDPRKIFQTKLLNCISRYMAPSDNLRTQIRLSKTNN